MSLSHEQNRLGIYDKIIPNLTDWPISKLSQNRQSFIDAHIEQSKAQILTGLKHPDELKKVLAKALYLERIRIKEDPWRVDPSDEKSFWNNITRKLIKISQLKPGEPETELDDEAFEEIISRYSHEIAGHFSPRAYKFSTWILPFLFSQFLNKASIWKIGSPRLHLRDRIEFTGNIELVRELSTKGTVVLTPTHFSNLDSPLIGWVIHVLGLPAFLYGAGLNLFNSKPFAFFMSRLGAYKVDRRKRNLLYLETLKTYSRMTLREGCHSLFFPGGTRSRSGQIEKQLKLGLLGTALEAQRLNYTSPPPNITGNPRKYGDKIFIVPLIINYHAVLEAVSLIDQHLKGSGREKYFMDKNVFPSWYQALKSMNRYFAAKSEMIISFGQPMDVLGNIVDANGTSLDRQGNPIAIERYFMTNDQLVNDRQRDEEYTRMLGEHILAQFYKYNTVLSSHLVAFTAYQILTRKYHWLDTYGLVRLPEEDREIDYQQFIETCSRLRTVLQGMQSDGKIQMADTLHGDIERIVKHGILNVGVYHNNRPLTTTTQGNITSQDMTLLLYYHNRLLGYELEKNETIFSQTT
ncbi:MAG: 1-acyl-sn-glycerol-3-phosphate acyltransferase [Sphingobacteriales bacterium]|jgi:glycerol-3-phosphate O-acyltransferase|nr:1-acyl-sn-glycerol-3-phosphate acyltransferase [Sphingobacteriales bacterium]MBP9142059.1 1-acyl-sn-glycerol-3-phosphate acyltransferase [Chitinophagales bacterium]MDA0198177.1 1-acyl-sn-glycerol-3-phosphate acyltransferase [Bacteroidota bacterium]MBK6889607.1 1-acyl-sn-glycerol-3-phosphate acyltransferase [Sphingobacteriales bacterium]MBK7527882.1 1-acyl-sn-glycerol-3-phosphate acyltransferase [Sphingobacteriales bacterium]